MRTLINLPIRKTLPITTERFEENSKSEINNKLFPSNLYDTEMQRFMGWIEDGEVKLSRHSMRMGR